MRYPYYFLVIISLLLLPSSLEAGRLYARKPGTASPLYLLEATNVRSSVTIRNLLAITHVDEEFRNSEKIALEGYYVFQLPEGAIVDGLWLWEDGVRKTFVVKRKEEAILIYDSLVQKGIGAPAILETLGENRFQLKVFPIKANSTRRIELQYFQILSINDSGIVRYYYPMNLAGYQSVSVEKTEIQIDLHSDFPISQLKTNFDDRPLALRVSRIDSSRYHIDFGNEDMIYSEDFILTFVPENWRDAFPSLSYAEPDTIADGYFVLWTPVKPDPGEIIKTDFVFVLDASASMTGLRIDATRAAFAGIIDKLQPYDRFRLVLFSNTTCSFPSDTSMMFGVAENKEEAKRYLSQFYNPNGVTNFETGIREGMKTNFRKDSERRMIFLTDELTNDGAKNPEQLLPLLMGVDSIRTLFYPVTIFSEKLNMLYSLSQMSGGKMLSIEQGEDLATLIERLVFDFTTFHLTDIALTAPQTTYFIYPEMYPKSMSSGEVVATGRFIGSISDMFSLSFRWKHCDTAQVVTRIVSLLPDTLNPVEVARYWAAMRIKRLLDDLKFATDSTEIKESIIRLSEKFMILTPFTAFLIIQDPVGPNIVEALGTIPETCRLYQNFPNPFISSTVISYYFPDGDSYYGKKFTLKVFDMLGREIRTLRNGFVVPGVHFAQWDGKDDENNLAPAGIYFCVLRVGNFTQTIRVTLIR